MKSISHNEGAFTTEESHIDFFVLLLIKSLKLRTRIVKCHCEFKYLKNKQTGNDTLHQSC